MFTASGVFTTLNMSKAKKNIMPKLKTKLTGKNAAAKLPKITQPKNANGTAKGAHQLKGTSLFGGPIAKRSYP